MIHLVGLFRLRMEIIPHNAESPDDGWYVALVAQYQSALSALAFSLVPDRSAAEEIVQETNLVLWNKRTEFEKGTNFRAWAFRILRFQVMAFQKREKRRKIYTYDDEVLAKLADQAQTVLNHQSDKVAALRSCLNKLSSQDRSLIENHYFENQQGSSMEQQAESADRSIGAFRQVLYRIRNSLRLCIEKTIAGEKGLSPS